MPKSYMKNPIAMHIVEVAGNIYLPAIEAIANQNEICKQ